MNTEISKVVAEMRLYTLALGQGEKAIVCDFIDRIERALQQPASADVEREASDMAKALEWVRNQPTDTLTSEFILGALPAYIEHQENIAVEADRLLALIAEQEGK